MSKLEELLNKLIEKGWKPFNMELIDKVAHSGSFLNFMNISISSNSVYSLNDLCSLDSGLWQFVCGLDKNYLPFCSKCYIKINSNNDKIKSDEYYEEEVNFWLMLSSIQENKEQFLLDNIIIDEPN